MLPFILSSILDSLFSCLNLFFLTSSDKIYVYWTIILGLQYKDEINRGLEMKGEEISRGSQWSQEGILTRVRRKQRMTVPLLLASHHLHPREDVERYVTRIAKTHYCTCCGFLQSEKWRNQQCTRGGKSFSLVLAETWYTQWQYRKEWTQKQAHASFVCKLEKRIKTSVELVEMNELLGLTHWEIMCL